MKDSIKMEEWRHIPRDHPLDGWTYHAKGSPAHSTEANVRGLDYSTQRRQTSSNINRFLKLHSSIRSIRLGIDLRCSHTRPPAPILSGRRDSASAEIYKGDVSGGVEWDVSGGGMETWDRSSCMGCYGCGDVVRYVAPHPRLLFCDETIEFLHQNLGV